MAGIFISYRRGEANAWAGWLHDQLRQRFGHENVFIDIRAIEPGSDFIEDIECKVASCDVLIALIGKEWLAVTDATGQRRLDDPEDFVRREIATALQRKIRVIPVLLQDTQMPGLKDLPADLQLLARRNFLRLSETHFHHEVDQLVKVLAKELLPARLEKWATYCAIGAIGGFGLFVFSMFMSIKQDHENPALAALIWMSLLIWMALGIVSAVLIISFAYKRRVLNKKGQEEIVRKNEESQTPPQK